MTKILFISHDAVGRAMAGPGIRAAELARVLANEHTVTLATPHPADWLPEGVRGHLYRWGDPDSLAPALAEAELLIANAQVVDAHPELAAHPAPLALDMYDPTPLENLALMRDAGPDQRAAKVREDIALLVRQLRAGDCFLCATERQRDMYIGTLLAVGRVNEIVAEADPTMRGLLRVVPFGLPAEPPDPLPPPWSGIDDGAPVILWSGGLWDWMDPLTLIRAMPRVLAAQPSARLVFLAGPHPGNNHPMRMPGQARALAAELGLLDREVRFVERWTPYAERSGALLHAAVAVYLHPESLESRYAAVRSRFLDHLWAGLPSVVSAGDAAADLVAAHGLGYVVAPGDVAATADALIALLGDDDARRRCAERALALAAEYTWERAAAPLLDFCRSPQRAPDRQYVAPISPPAPPDDTGREVAERDRRAREQDAARNAALGALAASWQASEPPLPGGLLGRVRRVLIEQIVRPLVAPLAAQQNAHNAAVLRALDALAESADARRSDMYALLDQQSTRIGTQLFGAETRLDRAEAVIARHDATFIVVRNRLSDLDDADTALAERIAALEDAPPEEAR